MFDEELERLEKLFRKYQGPPVDKTQLKGLLSEVENFLIEFPNDPRLTTLQREIVEALK